MASALQAAQAASEGWLSVPWIIWAGVLSAGVASFASWLTSRASAANSLAMLRKQHDHDLSEASRQREHDAKQKDEDRKGAIRREVYVKVIEQTHALLGVIGGLPERPLGGDDTEGFQAFLKANANIWLVADAEAAHLSRDLAGDFAELFLRQLKAASPLRLALEPVRQRKEQIAFENGEVRRLAAKLTDARALRAPAEELEKLADLATEHSGYVQALEQAQQQTLQEIAPQRMDEFRATFAQLRPVQRALVRMVSALRAELNLARDDEQFMEQLKNMERRAWAAVNEAYGNDPAWPMPEIVEKVKPV